MPQSIDFEKQMTEIVYINLPGPPQAEPGMSGGELLLGFLAEVHNSPLTEMKPFVNSLCNKWNVRYVEPK